MSDLEEKWKKIDEARAFLESEGFYVDNLWHIEDVQSIFDCTEEEAMEVLGDAVSGEWIMEHINDRIYTTGVDNGLKLKE